MDRIRTMPHRHDGAVLTRVRGDFELAGHALGGDDQRVIASGEKRRRDAVEESVTVVHDHRGLAVHRRRGAADRPAVDHADGLVTEADAENRHARAKPADHIYRDARVLGTTRPRRDQDLLGRHRLDLPDGHLIVPAYADLRAEL